MRIVLTTRGRASLSRQRTLGYLPESILRDLVVVCPEGETRFFTRNWPIAAAIPEPPDMRLSPKRRWVVTELYRNEEAICLLDDDLEFATRRDDQPDKFKKATHEQIEQRFAELAERITADTPHAGFLPRQAGHNEKFWEGGWHVGAYRAMYLLAYHVPTVLRDTDPFRVATRSDFDMTLQLLTRGHPFCMCYSFTIGQSGTQAKGGCSLYRTADMMRESAEFLAAQFPGLVALREKEYKGGGDVSKRTEIVVQWKRALEQGAGR